MLSLALDTMQLMIYMDNSPGDKAFLGSYKEIKE